MARRAGRFWLAVRAEARAGLRLVPEVLFGNVCGLASALLQTLAGCVGPGFTVQCLFRVSCAPVLVALAFLAAGCGMRCRDCRAQSFHWRAPWRSHTVAVYAFQVRRGSSPQRRGCLGVPRSGARRRRSASFVFRRCHCRARHQSQICLDVAAPFLGELVGSGTVLTMSLNHRSW